ncbi:MAG: histidine kinase [Bacteroidia bacterium]|nr:histidine kinase [Bacteroidia bacterium]MDW8158609.1 histidine kinase [Bacteroidia bacterium]
MRALLSWLLWLGLGKVLKVVFSLLVLSILILAFQRVELITQIQQQSFKIYFAENKKLPPRVEEENFPNSKLEGKQWQFNYHSFDWIEWQEKENGIYVKSVYSPLIENVFIGQDYLEPGDRLLQVENKNIPDLYIYRQIMYSTPPTLFLRCRVLKGGSFQQIAHYYILYGYRPLLGGTSSSRGYKIFFYLNIIGAFSGITLLALSWPFLKVNFSKNYFLFFWLGLVSLFFIFQCIRFIVIENDLQFRNYVFNHWASIIAIIFWVLITLGIVVGEDYNNIKLDLATKVGVNIGIAGIAIFVSYVAIKCYFVDFEYCELLLYAFYYSALGYWILQLYEKKSLPFWALIVIAAIVSFFCLNAWVKLLKCFSIVENYALPNSILEVGANFIFVFPLVVLSRTLIKYGDIRLVVSRSLLYLFLVFMTFTSYLFFHEIFKKLIFHEVWRGLVELSSIVLSLSVVRYFYFRYEPYIQKYIKIGSSLKEEQVFQFLSISNKATHLQELIENTQKAIIKIFNASFCYIFNDNEQPELVSLPGLRKVNWKEVSTLVAQYQDFWSANKEFHTPTFLSSLENALLNSRVCFIFRMPTTEAVYLCIVGTPQKGIYTFSDLNLFRRLLGQIVLHLEILHLIEKEKILSQKTTEAQLIALRAQINPHFLFNTFNSISELIHVSPQQAEEALEKLAYIIRYTLKVSNETFVPLAGEMQLVKTYLDIEKIRFGDRFSFSIEWPEDLGMLLVPALVIQTVVENCIKHGISKITGPGIVKIGAAKEENFIVFHIYDNGPGINLERIDKGTGLRNIIERLSKIYNMKDSIQFFKKDIGTEVVIKFRIDSTKSLGVE